MGFDDPNLRAVALQQIDRLQRLADDLAGIVAGTGPSKADLDKAVLLRNFRVTERLVPCLRGLAYGHPELDTGLIMTSQLYALDPEGRWARTLSRYYRLMPLDQAQHPRGTVQ
jgi:hypothetical protein